MLRPAASARHGQSPLLRGLTSELLQMVLGIAEGKLEGGETAEVVARVDLLRHAHAAVDLDRFLPDVATGPADDDLGRRHHPAASIRVLLVAAERGEVAHRLRLLDVDEHLHHAVLQCLEGADGNAELLARLRVLDRGLKERLERPDRLRAAGGDGYVVDRDDRAPGGALPPPPAP